MVSDAIRARAVKAAAKYLEMSGYEVMEGDFEGFVVARDLDSVAFAAVDVGTGYFKEFSRRDEEGLRERFEEAIVDYFASGDAEPDVRVRLDKISVSVVGSDRAVLKHFVNVHCEE